MDKRCVCGTVTVGQKGQIVIPKKARDYFNYQIGDELIVFADPELGVTLVKADTIEQLKKLIKTYEEMEASK